MKQVCEVRVAGTDAEVERCYPVLAQLRPHVKAEEFLERIRRQMAPGYRIAYIEVDGEVAAVAGFRLCENLFVGRFLYVDDLVTEEGRRSHGLGKQLLDWLVAYGRHNGCTSMELDSGVQRFDAHRFYLRERMKIRSHHFSLPLQ